MHGTEMLLTPCKHFGFTVVAASGIPLASSGIRLPSCSDYPVILACYVALVMHYVIILFLLYSPGCCRYYVFLL